MYYIESLIEVDKWTGGTVGKEMTLKICISWLGAMLGSFCGQYATILSKSINNDCNSNN